MSNSCVYCRRVQSNIYNIFGMDIRIILLGKKSPTSNICILCYLDKKHVPDLGTRFSEIIFERNCEEKINILPKHILARLREERAKELVCIAKNIDYELPTK